MLSFWNSCRELWLVLHGDEETRGLGREEETAPGRDAEYIQSDTQYVGDFLAVFYDKVHMKEDN